MKHNSIFKVRFTVFLLMSLICMKGLGHSPKAVAQGSQDAPLYQLFVWMKNGEKTGYLSTDKPEIRLDGENVKFSTIHTELYILNEDLDKFTLEPWRLPSSAVMSSWPPATIRAIRQRRVFFVSIRKR